MPSSRANAASRSLVGPGIGSANSASAPPGPRQLKTSGSTTRPAPCVAAARISASARSTLARLSEPDDIWMAAARSIGVGDVAPLVAVFCNGHTTLSPPVKTATSGATSPYLPAQQVEQLVVKRAVRGDHARHGR